VVICEHGRHGHSRLLLRQSLYPQLVLGHCRHGRLAGRASANTVAAIRPLPEEKGLQSHPGCAWARGAAAPRLVRRPRGRQASASEAIPSRFVTATKFSTGNHAHQSAHAGDGGGRWRKRFPPARRRGRATEPGTERTSRTAPTPRSRHQRTTTGSSWTTRRNEGRRVRSAARFA